MLGIMCEIWNHKAFFLLFFYASLWTDLHESVQYWKQACYSPRKRLFFAGVHVCISAQRIYRPGQGKRSGYKCKILKRQHRPVVLAHDAFLCYLLWGGGGHVFVLQRPGGKKSSALPWFHLVFTGGALLWFRTAGGSFGFHWRCFVAINKMWKARALQSGNKM